MLSKVYSAAIQGIDALPVTIETVVERGATFTIVGLPDTAVRESQMRILSAIREAGIEFPRHRVTINLAPADIKKEGASYDLPLAIGVLASSGIVPLQELEGTMFAGELSLDGSILPVKGALPMAIKARELGFRRLVIPKANALEGAVVNNLEVIGCDNFAEVVDILKGVAPANPVVVDTRAVFAAAVATDDLDFADVRGQWAVKRALEVACAGGHNVLLIGPPGAGKSMMAKRLPGIMPPLTLRESLETTKIHSVAGSLSQGSMLMTRRPFRTPHHTISQVAMVGGGTYPQPGEISLAHNGILFLDEFPEYPRALLEVLRQPLEDRKISISRARYKVEYPAGFMLVASMNPCPCGYHNHPTRRCTCSPYDIARYMGRISGPLLDRIDLQMEIQPVEFQQMADTTQAEPSAEIRKRVVRAREIQQQRYAGEKDIHCNAQIGTRLIKKYAWPDPEGLEKLRERMTRLSISARAFDRILRVARTIADLEGVEHVGAKHVSEAIGYRNLDRAHWGTSPNQNL